MIGSPGLVRLFTQNCAIVLIWMTDLLQFSTVPEVPASSLSVHDEDALLLNATVPFTAVVCGCRRPWFTSASLASLRRCAGQPTCCRVGLAGVAVRDIALTYGEPY